MVKKITAILGFVVLAVFILGVAFFKSPGLQNFVFYKTSLTPKEIFNLNSKINSNTPTDTSGARVELFREIDSFMKNSVNGKGFSMKPYALIKVRLDQALAEIPKTVVPAGKVKVWYIYNMGVIIKSDTVTVAFGPLLGLFKYERFYKIY